MNILILSSKHEDKRFKLQFIINLTRMCQEKCKDILIMAAKKLNGQGLLLQQKMLD